MPPAAANPFDELLERLYRAKELLLEIHSAAGVHDAAPITLWLELGEVVGQLEAVKRQLEFLRVRWDGRTYVPPWSPQGKTEPAEE